LCNCLSAQNTSWSSSGSIGIGTTTPSTPLEVKLTGNNSNTIKASGFDMIYDASRINGTPTINSQNGIGGAGYDMGGLSYINDGNNFGMGLTSQQRLIINYGQAPGVKFFRVLNPSTNLGNFSLDVSTRDPGVQSPYWAYKGGTSISAFNQPLNIGSYSSYPVRIYADGGNANKVADIYISNSQIGIATEAPNSNAKLDVNGNIYSNGKVYIGIADATTTSKIANYSLAVNGAAIFTKATVKLNTNWPDYVFHPAYKLPSLDQMEKFIKENKHLPEVPSAEEIQKNGIDLGDNQTLLLKKIEELTLFIIEQNKHFIELTKDVKNLKLKSKRY
jgi:hypothetical protein